MTAVQFHVNEVFDIPARGGLIAVGFTRNRGFVGVPRLRDDVSGHAIHVLGVGHPGVVHATYGRDDPGDRPR
ncbi:hypothetical protein OHA21_41725 [Actinoplanes sp. NBC_00393]|uniref:hypothetical protein n=1 Tax=Actinoplanes sp. NBC_00393 TaxID=2975953 RepID=UPI002E1ED8CC